MLVVLGASYTGKTQWASSLFSNPLELTIGNLLFFPDGLRELDRQVHDGIVLDDVRDLDFVDQNQDKLQALSHKVMEFGSTPGGTCAFTKWLWKIPMVLTINYSTKHLDYLENHDWLKLPTNRVLVKWPEALNAVRGGGIVPA